MNYYHYYIGHLNQAEIFTGSFGLLGIEHFVGVDVMMPIMIIIIITVIMIFMIMT